MINLFVYVEGEYDQMFFEGVINRLIIPYFVDNIIIIPYAQKNPKIINKDIKSKSNHKYVFLSDLDSHHFPCITSRKDKRLLQYNGLDSSKVFIVKEEIESWFLAGINTSNKLFEDLIIPDTTDEITKEDFNELLENSNIHNKRNFLMDVCANFDVELAIKRNKSFKYFLNKILNMFNS